MQPSEQVIDLLMQYTHPNGPGKDLEIGLTSHWKLEQISQKLATAIERETGRADAYIYVDPKERIRYRTTPPTTRLVYRCCSKGEERQPSWGTLNVVANVAFYKYKPHAVEYAMACIYKKEPLPENEIIRIFQTRMTRTTFRRARLVAWLQSNTTPDTAEYIFADAKNINDIAECGHFGLKGIQPWIFPTAPNTSDTNELNAGTAHQPDTKTAKT